MPSNIIGKIKETILSYAMKNKTIKMKLFKMQAKQDLQDHFKETEYIEHIGLMKEINYLLHYTFLVLEDDYNKGDKVFIRGITNLDDYIFSDYKNKTALVDNIKRLRTVAFSNRFEETPKDNFLYYFVFIEEMGFELIEILDEYYHIVSEKKRVKEKKPKLSKEDGEYLNNTNKEKTMMLLTEKMTRVIEPNKVQEFILNESLEDV